MPKIWKMSFWKNPVANQHGAGAEQVPYGMTNVENFENVILEEPCCKPARCW